MSYYLVTMWCVIFMRNSNSTCPLISLVGFICLLFKNKMNHHIMGSNKLCAYYNPIKMWTFEVCHLDLILYIIYFLCGMFAQTSSNFPLRLSFGSCLGSLLGVVFLLYVFHIFCEKPFFSSHFNHGYAGWFE